MADVVVLGSGPTGIFAAEWLRERGKTDLVVVGLSSHDLLRPFVVAGQRITVPPILPPWPAPAFPPVPRSGTLVCVRRRGARGRVDGAAPTSARTGSAASFATFARQRLPAESAVLAFKQFGNAIYDRPLTEVRQKIARSYLTGRDGSRQRLGYVSGESPYAHMVRRLSARHRILHDAPVAIDPNRRLVLLASGRRIRYRHVVSTVSLDATARLLGLAGVDSPGAPAHFAVLAVAGVPANELVYDLDVESPVFRLVSPHVGLVVAQMNPDVTSPDVEHSLVDVVADRVEHLLGWRGGRVNGVHGVRIVGHIRVDKAYPVDPPTPAWWRRIASRCAAANVTLLGRYAEWKYIDLHEVSWTERLVGLCDGLSRARS